MHQCKVRWQRPHPRLGLGGRPGNLLVVCLITCRTSFQLVIYCDSRRVITWARRPLVPSSVKQKLRDVALLEVEVVIGACVNVIKILGAPRNFTLLVL